MSNIPTSTPRSLMPMAEVYQHIYDDVASMHNALASATSPKGIRSILRQISNYPVDNRVSEKIRHTFEDIKGSVSAMYMYDFTRSDMVTLLENLLAALRLAIEEEEKKERTEKLRNAFLFMADHAEEFTEWWDNEHHCTEKQQKS